jgi:hypothetical protein
VVETNEKGNRMTYFLVFVGVAVLGIIALNVVLAIRHRRTRPSSRGTADPAEHTRLAQEEVSARRENELLRGEATNAAYGPQNRGVTF